MPVDVASGTLYHLHRDFVMPGRFALSMERRYSTALIDGEAGTLFGPGWRCPFEVSLYREPDGYDFVGESGESVSTFPCEADGALPAAGAVDPGAFAELRRVGDELVLTRRDPASGEAIRDVFDAHATAARPDEADAHGRSLRLLRRERSDGEGLAFAYDARSGLLRHVVQRREGRGFTFERDGRGRVVALVRRAPPAPGAARGAASAGVAETVFRYGYDVHGRLVEAVDPDGNAARYVYDAAGRMIGEVTLAGKRRRFDFDGLGRCVLTTAAQRFDRHRLDYGRPGARLTAVTGPDGGVTRYRYDERGLVVRRTSPLGGVERTVFDPFGRIVQRVGEDGGVSGWAYDEAGELEAVTLPGGGGLRFEHDDERRLVAMTDEAGGRWTLERDAVGRLSREIDPLGTERRYVRDRAGDVVEIHVDGALFERRAHDHAGELLRREDADGHRVRYVRDAFGNVLEYHEPGGAVTRVERDVHGRGRRLHLPGGGVRRYDWDVFDNLVREVDESGAETRYRYCRCGNLEEIIRPDGARVSFGWNPVPGQLATVTNELDEVAHFDYDADGRLAGERDFAGRETRYAYSADRRTIRVRKASGRTLEFVHDLAGRPVEVCDPDSGERAGYAWDARGLLAGASLGDARLAFEYDALGRLVAETSAAGTIRHDYDALGRRVARHDAAGETVAYGWSAAGRLRSVTAGAVRRLDLRYDERGLERVRTGADGGEIGSAHDPDGRLVERWTTFDGERCRRTFEYDARGELVRRTWSGDGLAPGGAHRSDEARYAIDACSRIERAAGPDGVAEHLRRDAGGNVVAFDDVTLVHERGSVVRAAGDVSFEHDAEGRLVARTDERGTTRFRWSFLDALVGVDAPDGARWTYAHDPLGRRIGKRGPDAEHRFEWDGDDLHAESVEREGRVHRTVWEHHPHDHALLYGVRDGETHLALTDVAGTPEAFRGPDGRCSWLHETSLYGRTRRLVAATFDCDLRFPGQYHDRESGLSCNRFRHYSPELGAYVTDDPLGLDGGTALRAYVPNPLTWIDPFGLTGKKCPPTDGDTPSGGFMRALGRRTKAALLGRALMALLGQDPEAPGIELDPVSSNAERTQNARRRQAETATSDSGQAAAAPPGPPPEPPPAAAPSTGGGGGGGSGPPRPRPRPTSSPRPNQPHVNRFGSNKGPMRSHKWR